MIFPKNTLFDPFVVSPQEVYSPLNQPEVPLLASLLASCSTARQLFLGEMESNADDVPFMSAPQSTI